MDEARKNGPDPSAQGEGFSGESPEEEFKNLRITNESLKAANQDLHSVFDLTGVAVTVVDESQTIIAHNRAALVKFGNRHSTLMHRKCCEFICGFPAPPPDCPVIKASFLGQPVERKGMVCGGMIFDVVASPVKNQDGEVVRTVLAFSDITDRQRAMEKLAESEERYRDLFENTSDLIQICDAEGKILFVNDSWRKTMGMDDPAGVGIEALISPEKLDKFMKTLKSAMKKRESIHFETEYVSAGGRKILLDGNLSWSADSKGALAARAIMRDVTRQRRMEEELSTARRLDLMGRFAEVVAHDVNNVLTAILGNISLARMYGQKGYDPADKLEKAEQSVLKARDLTKRLLAFSAGGEPVRRETSLPDLVKDSINFILSRSKVRAEFNIAKNLYKVEADPGLIEQVLQNLALNSAEAMEPGGTIKVECVNVSVDKRSSLPLAPGPYVRISITDRGVGMPREHLEEIFEPFFTTKDGAKGLGLTSAFSIIKKHGGTIAADSSIGLGTRMEVYLPALTESGEEEKPFQEAAPGAGRILVMDDEEDIRDLLGAVLAHKGYDVATAPDGEAALKLYSGARQAGNPFDLVILDLTIPGGRGGQETMAALLAMDPEVNAVVSSGYSSDPVLVEYKAHGFRGVAVKPYRVEKLLDLISSLIKRE